MAPNPEGKRLCVHVCQCASDMITKVLKCIQYVHGFEMMR